MVMTFSIENSLQTYEWETKLIALILKEKKGKIFIQNRYI